MDVCIPGLGLRFAVSILRNEEFGVVITENHRECHILCNDGNPIEVSVQGFKLSSSIQTPQIMVELYVDGIIRNVVRPYTGRGLKELQFAEVKIDRGLVCCKSGRKSLQIMKAFRFIELDINSAHLNSRVVSNAGDIEVRIVNITEHLKRDEDDFKFDSPLMGASDLGAISYLEGDLNNTIGIRFDDGNDSLSDTKFLKLAATQDLINKRLKPNGAHKLLASFKFIYGDEDLLNHLGVIPDDHQAYDQEIAARRGSLEVTDNSESEQACDTFSEIDAAFDLESIDSSDNEIIADENSDHGSRLSVHEGATVELDASEEIKNKINTSNSSAAIDCHDMGLSAAHFAKFTTPRGTKKRARCEQTPHSDSGSQFRSCSPLKGSYYLDAPTNKRRDNTLRSPKTPEGEKQIRGLGLLTPPASAGVSGGVKKLAKGAKQIVNNPSNSFCYTR